MTAREEFQFMICPLLGSTPLDEIELTDVEWNDPVSGPGAGFSGWAAITRTQSRTKLRGLLVPDSVALYVRDRISGAYLFGGPLYACPWDREKRKLNIQAQSWKGWLYQKLYSMNRATNPVSNRTFANSNTDQFSIARNLLTAAMTGEVGCPTINLGNELSGVMRDLSVESSAYKYVGPLIDTMANRDSGFEWNIEAKPNNAGNPALWFVPAFPTRGGLNNQIILLHEVPQGGNILKLENPEESSMERRTRQWATGSGQPPDQMVAYDEDPALVDGFMLLREAVTSYSNSGITLISTLANHARSERIFRGQTLQQITLTMALHEPDFRTYSSGDKVRLRVVDEWTDWDFDSVRILDKKMMMGRDSDPDAVKLLIDLNDTEPPENQAVV